MKINIHINIALLVVLYKCEIESVALKDERRLTFFENGVPRKMFGPARYEVTGDWMEQHEECNELLSSQNIIPVIKSGRMRWGGHVENIRESRNVRGVLMDTPGRKRYLEDLGVRVRILLKCILKMIGGSRKLV